MTKTIFEMRINNYEHRMAVASALASAGYGVVIKERKRKDAWVQSADYFVCVISVPEIGNYVDE